MATYSIGDLEAITGIRAHTIRTWEQRYGILSPDRTATNIRQYSETQLRILSSLAFLIRQGVKISQLTGLSETALREQVRRYLDTKNEQVCKDIELLKMIAIQMDEQKFDKYFSTLILQRGFPRATTEIIYPFLEHISLFWRMESHLLGMEAFITSLFKRKVNVAIETLIPPKNKNQQTFLLFLPEKHPCEISLLFCLYELKSQGHHVVYLGNELPAKSVAHTARKIKADFILTSVIMCQQNLEEYMSVLSQDIKIHKQPIVVMGNAPGQAQLADLPVTYLTSFKEFRTYFSL